MLLHLLYGSLDHAPDIQIPAFEHVAKQLLLVDLLEQEPVALNPIILGGVRSIEDGSQL
jgi:hypothetical protein